MINIMTYWLITGTLTLLLIYRMQRNQEVVKNLIKLRYSTTAQVLFLVAAFTLGALIIPFIIIYTTIKHFKRWGRKTWQ